jgi:hypothetical protein
MTRHAPRPRTGAHRSPGPAAAEPWDRIGWHPDHVIEIAISPRLRQADHGRPLSLLEALDTGRAPRPPAAEPEPEPEP